MSGVEPIPPIELTVETRVSPAHAWQALTDPERVALWFTTATPVGPVGTPYRLDFGEGSVVAGIVTALEPGERFGYTWCWEGAGDGPSEETRVEWRVSALPSGGSRIALVHDGWAEGGSNVVARDDHEAYWSGYLDDLRDVLDEG